MIIKNKAAVAAFVAGIVVAGGGVAVAADHSLILGDNNKASATTGLKNTGSGPVLKLAGPSGAPPLAVNSDKRVTNLNADKFDNLDSKSFALTAGRSAALLGGGFNVDLNGDQVYDVFVAEGVCPAGTIATGGGFENYTPDVEFVSESNAANDGWLVVTPYNAANASDDLIAVAQCYNPRGTVPGGVRPALQTHHLSEQDRAQLARIWQRRSN